MILPALAQEFRTLFARESRARVALWFDEKRDVTLVVYVIGVMT